MKCEVILDLIPLYVDDCCSEESKKMVEDHIAVCSECKCVMQNMKKTQESIVPAMPAAGYQRISSWKASVLQSVSLMISFLVLAFGVLREGNTPIGYTNGLWAAAMIVPATGYLLSMGNWYFIRSYRSRKSFSRGSWLTTLAITSGAYIWWIFHYSANLEKVWPALQDSQKWTMAGFAGIGLVLTAVFCVLSGVLSSKYAKMLGKE